MQVKIGKIIKMEPEVGSLIEPGSRVKIMIEDPEKEKTEEESNSTVDENPSENNENDNESNPSESEN